MHKPVVDSTSFRFNGELLVVHLLAQRPVLLEPGYSLTPHVFTIPVLSEHCRIPRLNIAHAMPDV